MVTNKKKRLKNNQACLKLFFKRFFFQSGALREGRSQSLLLEIILFRISFFKAEL
jgi:hypothetical protein